MKKISIQIAILTSLLLSQQLPVKSQESAAVITGRQYVYDDNQLTAASNSKIFYIACNKISCTDFRLNINTEHLNHSKKWIQSENKKTEITERFFACITKNKSYNVCNREEEQEMNKIEFVLFVSMDMEYKKALELVFERADIVRTDEQGNYSIKCPTSTCLIFSNIIIGNYSKYWVEISANNDRLDLTDSNSLSFVRRRR